MNGTVCIPVWTLWGAGGIFALWLIVKFAFSFRLWVAATAAGAPVSAWTLLGMRLRRVDPKTIVEPYIIGVKAGVDVDVAAMEAFHLAGGDVAEVVRHLIRARNNGQRRRWAEVAEEHLRS